MRCFIAIAFQLFLEYAVWGFR